MLAATSKRRRRCLFGDRPHLQLNSAGMATIDAHRPPSLRLNNEGLLASLNDEELDPTRQIASLPRQRELSYFVLPSGFPSESRLESDARRTAAESRHAAVIKASLTAALSTPLEDRPPAAMRREKSVANAVMWNGPAPEMKKVKSKKRKHYESYELLRAIEKKDLQTLVEIRDHQFDLLTGVVNGTTPLVHAMRQSDPEMAVVLTGAFSRFVNHAVGDTPPTEEQKGQLKAIRAALKMAIAHGVAARQTELLASHLQVITISEGEKWIVESAQDVALALRAGKKSRPVASASKLVDKWIGREIIESDQIATVQDYQHNSVCDLIVLGLWSVVQDFIPGDPLPTYFFARDDRLPKALKEHVEALERKARLRDKLPGWLRGQIEQTLEVLLRRNTGMRQKTEDLRKLLDAPVDE